MKSNVGANDRMLRAWAGAVLIGLSIAEIIGPWGYVGVIPLISSVMGYCPAYHLFGLNTCPRTDAAP